MKEYNYSDLEDSLYKVWQTGEDLDLFVTQYCDAPTHMSEDDVFNILYGLKKLHDLRMQHTFDMFERVFKLNDYAPDEVKAKREEIFNQVLKVTTKKKGKKK